MSVSGDGSLIRKRSSWKRTLRDPGSSTSTLELPLAEPPVRAWAHASLTELEVEGVGLGLELTHLPTFHQARKPEWPPLLLGVPASRPKGQGSLSPVQKVADAEPSECVVGSNAGCLVCPREGLVGTGAAHISCRRQEGQLLDRPHPLEPTADARRAAASRRACSSEVCIWGSGRRRGLVGTPPCQRVCAPPAPELSRAGAGSPSPL